MKFTKQKQEVLKWTCPICKKEITSPYAAQLESWAKEHNRVHESKEELK